MIEGRFSRVEEFGEDKLVRRSAPLNASVTFNTEEQNVMLIWFVNEAKGVERSFESIARRLPRSHLCSRSYDLSCEPHQLPHEPPIACACRRLQNDYTVLFLTQNMSKHSPTTSRLQ
jgi:hypothetical protein